MVTDTPKAITKLPEFLQVCPLCKGAGSYDQVYTAGCGMGTFTSKGSCEMCGKNETYCGPGFVYAGSGAVVTESIIAQVLTMNGIDLSPRDWTVERQLRFPSPPPLELENANA